MRKLPKISFILVAMWPTFLLLNRIFLSCDPNAFGGFYNKLTNFTNKFIEQPLMILFILGVVLAIISIFIKNKTRKEKIFIRLSLYSAIIIIIFMFFLLSSLNTARTKGNQAVGKSYLANIRELVNQKIKDKKEDYINTNDCYKQGSLFDDNSIINIIELHSKSKIKPRCFSDGENWAVSFQLGKPKNDGLFCSYDPQLLCVDSSGFLNFVDSSNINSPSCTSL